MVLTLLNYYFQMAIRILNHQLRGKYMKYCIHCENEIEDPNRKKFCSNWCAKDYSQPEENRSLKSNTISIKDGVYEEETS